MARPASPTANERTRKDSVPESSRLSVTGSYLTQKYNKRVRPSRLHLTIDRSSRIQRYRVKKAAALASKRSSGGSSSVSGVWSALAAAAAAVGSVAAPSAYLGMHFVRPQHRSNQATHESNADALLRPTSSTSTHTHIHAHPHTHTTGTHT